MLRIACQWFVAAMVVSALQASQVYSLEIPGSSMEPTIRRGETVLVEPMHPVLFESLAIGDIVVLSAPSTGQTLVKRIVGMPADEIEIRDKLLFRNGSRVDEDYVRHTDPLVERDLRDDGIGRDQLPPTILPSGVFFVLGDNRDQSFDSRFFGGVDGSLLLGRVRRNR